MAGDNENIICMQCSLVLQGLKEYRSSADYLSSEPVLAGTEAPDERDWLAGAPAGGSGGSLAFYARPSH